MNLRPKSLSREFIRGLGLLLWGVENSSVCLKALRMVESRQTRYRLYYDRVIDSDETMISALDPKKK